MVTRSGFGMPLAVCALITLLAAAPASAAPAARLTDFHEAPMTTPFGPAQVPHVGGPVTGGPEPMLITDPVTNVGNPLIAVGPPDAVIQGSSTVSVMGVPAARMGDQTAHGGQILIGDFNVEIGG